MIARYLFPFEKLDVWHMSLELGDFILNLLEQLPQNRHLRLISQMEGAAVSPALNIAEGKGRQYKKEFIQFLHIAQGSIFEVVTLNEIFRRNRLFDEEAASEVRKRCEQIDRKLNGLINFLRGSRRENSFASNLKRSAPPTSNEYKGCLQPKAQRSSNLKQRIIGIP